MDERAKKNYEEYYVISKVIGQGAFGIIYKGKEKGKDELRAIKVIDLEKIKENLILKFGGDIEEQLKIYINELFSEYKNMEICSLNNENSVKCYEFFHDEDNFTIIMELCDTNLSKILTERLIKHNKGFNSEEILEILKQLNNAFKVMEEKKIIHRDLKLENILLKYIDKEHKKYIIKLCDYGSSKKYTSLTKNYFNSVHGTLLYMAPEILKEEEYNYKCDLWSIGIIIYQLYFGNLPYFGDNEIG